MEELTVHVQLLSLVLQRHQVLGFGGHSFKPTQTPTRLLLGLMRSSLSQEVVQVLGEVIGLLERDKGPSRDREMKSSVIGLP